MSTIGKCCRMCFPNGCCGFCKPPVQIQNKIVETIIEEKREEKKKIPYGYINIYPGVLISNEKYTSPMLVVHLYRQSEYKAGGMEDKQTVAASGTNLWTERGPTKLTKISNAEDEEEIIMIPVEDVIIIGSKTGVKKNIKADSQVETEPVYKESDHCCDRCARSLKESCQNMLNKICCCCCCQSSIKIDPGENKTTIVTTYDPNQVTTYEEEFVPATSESIDCCAKLKNAFRYWCCSRRVLAGYNKRTQKKAEQRATRTVTVTLEYSKYSHLDSSSHVRLLSEEHQHSYYKEKFAPNTKIDFYLVNNTEYDKDNFQRKRQQAETLCRTIMQLKAMKNNYPSEESLMKILDLSNQRTFGDEFEETRLEALPETTMPQIAQAPKHLPPTYAIGHKNDFSKRNLNDETDENLSQSSYNENDD